MYAYLEIVEKVMSKGILKENRTGIDTYAIAGAMFEHDMEKGFPLLTTKRVPFGLVGSELEFFIKGITDKSWLQERNNSIWDEWCDPRIVPYGNDFETKEKMMSENELGPIYGFQWRHFGAEHNGSQSDYSGQGFDQLSRVVDTLKKNPNDRRMIVSAWNPLDLGKMALPPCHYGFQVTVLDDKINLAWNQRSVDVMLGLPFNIASYATMLHLLSKETGYGEGKLIGFLMDTHIYENHLTGAREQLSRTPKDLPEILTENFDSIFNWNYKDSKIIDYKPDKKINFEIAV